MNWQLLLPRKGTNYSTQTCGPSTFACQTVALHIKKCKDIGINSGRTLHHSRTTRHPGDLWLCGVWNDGEYFLVWLHEEQVRTCSRTRLKSLLEISAIKRRRARPRNPNRLFDMLEHLLLLLLLMLSKALQLKMQSRMLAEYAGAVKGNNKNIKPAFKGKLCALDGRGEMSLQSQQQEACYVKHKNTNDKKVRFVVCTLGSGTKEEKMVSLFFFCYLLIPFLSILCRSS